MLSSAVFRSRVKLHLIFIQTIIIIYFNIIKVYSNTTERHSSQRRLFITSSSSSFDSTDGMVLQFICCTSLVQGSSQMNYTAYASRRYVRHYASLRDLGENTSTNSTQENTSINPLRRGKKIISSSTTTRQLTSYIQLGRGQRTEGSQYLSARPVTYQLTQCIVWL